MLEVSMPEVTRFHTCDAAEGAHNAFGSTIDDFFISTPGLAVPQLRVGIRSCKPATHATTLSDHVANAS